MDFINDYEYDLFIRPDTCNPRYRSDQILLPFKKFGVKTNNAAVADVKKRLQSAL